MNDDRCKQFRVERGLVSILVAILTSIAITCMIWSFYSLLVVVAIMLLISLSILALKHSLYLNCENNNECK